ncbi:MAG TPA: phosphoribosylanthranilate isomerase [Gammaproteobacteria bacterium]|nr:phosphoribosylanthranilate isomerase [Gammaproteobacteria bacterium]
MTRGEDVEAAARLGVDAVGLVFHEASPRHVSIAQARELVTRLPAFVTVTGLFLDPEREQVQTVLDQVRIDLLQFHGSESPEFCRSFSRRYIKAVPMGSQVDIADYARRYADAAALLLDSHASGQKGGTGVTFEWSRVPQFSGPPLILAGGLRPGNVAAAIGRIRPYGVDVSSGVESAPGIKDTRRMMEFVNEVNRVEGV